MSRRQQKKKSMASNISPFVSKLKKRSTITPAVNELCTCIPLAQMLDGDKKELAEKHVSGEQTVLVSQVLQSKIYALVQSFFPRTESLSILVLHMVQRDASSSRFYEKRRRCHAAYELFQQVLVYVRRAIRVDDDMILYGEAGVAIVFPAVDQSGMKIIAERIYRNICLLQAETLIPPLKRETTIVLGMGSYPDPAPTLDGMYQHTAQIAHILTLRPAITAQLRAYRPLPVMELTAEQLNYWKSSILAGMKGSIVPYMELPHVLSKRLTQLIPYQTACELQCAPVGWEDRCLTVAMREPSNDEAITRLQEVTGLTIFPVACEENELNDLLACSW
jgi:hypothetical protein